MASKKILCFLFLTITALNLFAQDVEIQKENKGDITLSFPTTAMFKDNEYLRKIAYGYTLAGVRMVPQIEYQPLENLKISLGVNLLRYWGANEYSSYNYVGVPYYDSVNVQHQLHYKPFFRVNWQINHNLNFIIGNIYTTNYHYLPIALFNPELVFSQDAQEGLQLLYKDEYWQNDTWLDWQNFNFYRDIDREQFAFGTSGNISTAKVLDKHKIGLSYAIIWQHHGGELDTVRTPDLDQWSNGMIGAFYTYNFSDRYNSKLTLNANYMFSEDFKNHTWRFSSGKAFSIETTYKNDCLEAKVGYFDSKKFISFYGDAFFSNLAQRDLSITYPHNQMLYSTISYDINLNKTTTIQKSKYIMSFVGEVYYKLDDKNSIEKEKKNFSIALGVVFKAKPSFRLFNKKI